MPSRAPMSTEPGLGLPIADEAREALEAARREHRELTETERAIAGAEALTPQEALATVEAASETDPGSREPMVINLGPQHPSTHGVLRLITELDGEVIRDLHPVIGYLHTGIEKQCENKTYWQGITLVTRMDYLASFFNIHAYTMAVERLLDLEVPDRAQYLRVIMSELNRITSHLVWLGTSGLELGAITLLFYTYREREKALDLCEMIAGDRMNTRYFQVGGCADDMPPGFEQRLRAFLDEMPGRIDEYEGLLSSNPIWLDRTKGIGVLPGRPADQPRRDRPGAARRRRRPRPAQDDALLGLRALRLPGAARGQRRRLRPLRDARARDARVGADHRPGARRDARGPATSPTTARWCCRRAPSSRPRWRRSSTTSSS